MRPALLLLWALCITQIAAAYDNLQLGAPSTDVCIVDRPGYALGYSEEHEQAAWVIYKLTAEEAQGGVSRTNDFREDPEIPTGSATLADYRGSGFDRGHLAPAADMAWSDQVMRDSFYMSNMSPQLPAFNRGVWLRLEAHVRSVSIEQGYVWVATGPVLEPGLEAIGPDSVSVPGFYFKVLLDPAGEMTAYLLPNAGSKAELVTFEVPVDSVEARTGLELFGALQNRLEQQVN